jgi:hypothetical protein
MEDFETNEKIKYSKEELEDARKYIAEIAEKEKSGELKTAHLGFEDFDAAELTDEDLATWIRCKTGTLTDPEFYQFAEHMREVSKVSRSRGYFSAFMRNKYIPEKTRKLLEEEKRKEDFIQ